MLGRLLERRSPECAFCYIPAWARTTNSASPSSSPNSVEGCNFERPFHLVVTDARGTASVTRYGNAGVEQICSGPAKANRLKMIPPLVVSLISSDGCGRSAKIEIVKARETMQ